MANVTDASAINFVNVNIRPVADQVAQLQTTLAVTLAAWSAKGMAALIPNDATAVIEDGSPADGRTSLTGVDVNAFIALLETLQGMASGQNSAMPTVLKIAVNPLKG